MYIKYKECIVNTDNVFDINILSLEKKEDGMTHNSENRCCICFSRNYETYERFFFDDSETTKSIFDKIDFDIRMKNDYLNVDTYLEKYKMDRGLF